MKTEEIFKIKDENKCACINRTDKVIHMLEIGAIAEIIHGDKNEKTTGLVTNIGDKTIKLYTEGSPSCIIHYDEITEVRIVTSSTDTGTISGIISKAQRTYGAGDPFLNLRA